MESRSLLQLYRLDLEEMTWNLHDARGPALASHSAVSYASDIYYFGGKARADAMESSLNDLWKYKYGRPRCRSRRWIVFFEPNRVLGKARNGDKV
jgi:hypothetical protein